MKRLKEYLNSARVNFALSPIVLKKYLILSCFLGIGVALGEFAFIKSLQIFFKQTGILKTLEVSVSAEKYLTTPLMAGATLLLLGLLRSILDGLKVFVSRYAMQLVGTSLRKKIINYSYCKDILVSSREVSALFTDDSSRASTSVLNLSTLLTNFTMALFTLAILLKVSYFDTLFALGLLFVFQFPIYFIGKSSSSYGKKLSHEWENVHEKLQESFRNSFYLKAFGTSDLEKEKSYSFLDSYLKNYKHVFKLISLKMSLPSFVGVCVIVLLIARNYFFGANSSQDFLITFIYLFIRFVQNVSIGLAISSDFLLNSQSSEKILNWLNTQKQKSDDKISEIQNRIKEDFDIHQEETSVSSLSFQNVDFYYQTNEVIFKDISFNLRTGDRLVITGDSGSGKSTLLSLVLGMNLARSGHVYVNARAIEHWLVKNENHKLLLDQIAYIGPFSYLTEGTIRENLLYGTSLDKSLSDEELYKGLEIAELKGKVMSLDKKLDSRLDEQGSSFSVGQLQRLMIAKAIVKNPKIIIMDECTSNLDYETEERVVNNLDNFLKDKIALIVTHRKRLKELATQELHLDAQTKVSKPSQENHQPVSSSVKQ